MTREELYKKIDDWQPERFEDIPEELQDAETAYRWITKGIGCLYSIPPNLTDDRLRLAAVNPKVTGGLRSDRCLSFKSIWPSHTDFYEKIALIAIADDYLNISYVHLSVMNNEFMMKALAVNGDCLYPLLGSPDDLEMRGITISQEMIDLAVSNSPAYFRAMPFRQDQYRVETVSKCIREYSFDPEILHKVGHYSTLIGVIKAGHWPSHFPDRPANLADGLNKIFAMPRSHEFYRAYVMSHPIEDVIAVIDTRDKKIELLKMYSRLDLEPFLKNSHLGKDQELKGLLLENELGL